MRVLNLYAGLGGNRKHWKGCEVTAVEMNESIAKFYSDHYPDDTVIVGDAHQYLLDNFKQFDFIWASTPCPSHSRARFWSSKGGKYPPVFPDLKLYEEILFLKHFCDSSWVVENVVPYYTPLIHPSIKIGRHLFWSNFNIRYTDHKDANIFEGKQSSMEKVHGISIDGYEFTVRKDKILRNCVHPDLGLHVYNESQRIGMFNLDDF